MKVLYINGANCGSTGKICLSLVSLLQKKDNTGMFLVPKTKLNSREKDESVFFGSKILRNISSKVAYLSGLQESFNFVGTREAIKKIDKFKPDIVHLHNIHGNYINIKLLFKYFKKKNVQIVWTLHDCWSFTGRCPHFTLSGCKKWKTGCYHCEYPKKDYPATKIDRTKYLWKKKKELITSINDLTIVTPSQWLADLARESFFKEKNIRVINNGIDLSIFKPTESNFRKIYNIEEDKFILLGVAFGWGQRKGLDVFIELTKRLNKDKFKIVLVGTDDNVDKILPKEIISIHRTQNQTELAEIYSACDLFVNPTREENYPTVNMESIACGTPVITFKTGGSPEILNEKSGSVVDCDDIDGLVKEIVRIEEERPYNKEDCINRAKSFDMNIKFKEYIDLYNEIASE